MEENKQIDKIIEVTAFVDDESRVWGRDTDLGSIEDIRKEVKELVKPFIISKLLIEKEITEKFTTAYKKIKELTTQIKVMKLEESENLFKLTVKNDKELFSLKDNFRIMSNEYSKLLRDWHQLKYPKKEI